MQIWLKQNRCISENVSNNVQTHLSEIATFLHATAMQACINHEKAVCPSVCLSDT